MGAVCYITPTERLTLTDQKTYRINAIAAAIDRAYTKSLGSKDDYPGLANIQDPATRVELIKSQIMQGNMPRSLDVREFQPILDAGAALDQWNTAALAVVGTAYSMFQAIAAPALAANKVVVFYRVGIETAPSPVSRVIFRSGGAAGNILALFDLEQLVHALSTEGYFSEPVVIDPNTTFAVQVLARIATGVLARVQLGNFVVEPAGQVIA